MKPNYGFGATPSYEGNFDGLRAIAALTVVAYHCKAPLASGGFVGVDLFFVLSGYLITSMLKAGAPGFYARRARRLAPAFLTLIATVLLVGPLAWPFRPIAEQWRNAAAAAFYVSDYVRAGGFEPLGHTWSLAVEAQFYLLWPLVVARLNPARAPVVLAALWVGLTAWRVYVCLVWGWKPAYYHADTHFSGLVLGALLTYAPPRPVGYGWLGLMLLAALTMRAHVGPGVIVAVPLAEFGAALTLLGARAAGPSALRSTLSSPPLTLLGLLSYGIYLWHFPAASIVNRLDWPWWSRLAVVAPFAIGVAGLSYVTIERWARLGRMAPKFAKCGAPGTEALPAKK